MLTYPKVRIEVLDFSLDFLWRAPSVGSPVPPSPEAALKTAIARAGPWRSSPRKRGTPNGLRPRAPPYAGYPISLDGSAYWPLPAAVTAAWASIRP